MRFTVDIHEALVPSYIDRLLSITGPEPWAKRISWLEHEVNENRFMSGWLLARCGLEWELGCALARGQFDKYDNAKRLRPAFYQLASFAAGVVQIFELLPDKGKAKLRGQLLDGLKADKGLLSVQHEISTAVHLVRNGFDIEFNDLKSGGGFDFLALKDGAEVEIECKTFSADIGRKIHARQSAKLYRKLESVLAPTFKASRRGLVVRVSLPDRLLPAEDKHEAIANAVSRGIYSGSEFITDDCSVSVYDFEISDSPFSNLIDGPPSRDLIVQFVEKLTGRRNPNLMVMGAPNGRVVLVLLESKKPDSVLVGIRRQLRSAADDQFTKARPACIVAQLHDLTNEQLLLLAREDSSVRNGASALQVMTSDFLESSSRSHVINVTYIAQAGPLGEDGVISSQGSCYTFDNKLHTCSVDKRHQIFEWKKLSRIILMS